MVDATIVIPTYRRPDTLPAAVASALQQTLGSHEVVVVDDGSPTPPRLPADPRLRVIELGTNRGACAARNAGVAAARGRWVTALDDDDLLTADHLEVALAAIGASELPAPVASLTGVELVAADGRVVGTRMPPTFPRGRAYSLEPRPPGTAFGLRCTLVVERDLLRSIGGWDERLRSREHTDLFLRLNPVCSLQGTPVVTYRRRRHDGQRLSADPSTRAVSQRQLEAEHRALLRARPDRYVDMLVRQGVRLWEGGERREALATWGRSIRVQPRRAAGHGLEALRARARRDG